MKRFKNMNDEERKEYRREASRRHREKKRCEAAGVEYVRPLTHQEFEKLRRDRNAIFLGESSPCENVTTSVEELQIAREFANALRIPDIQPNETIRTFTLRILRDWMKQPDGMYGLNRQTGRFDQTVLVPAFGSDGFTVRIS